MTASSSLEHLTPVDDSGQRLSSVAKALVAVPLQSNFKLLERCEMCFVQLDIRVSLDDEMDRRNATESGREVFHFRPQ